MTPELVPPDAELRRTAADWYLGARPAMLVYAGTGMVVAGLDREVRDCLSLLEEHGNVDADPVEEAEHDRLVVLLHRIEPELALLRAREIGREHGEAAAGWWQQDALGGRATDDATETARRVLHGVDDIDPEVLDALPGRMDGYTAAALWEDCDWEEPLVGDEAMYARWHAVGAQLWDAYQDEFQAAVRVEVVRACRDALDEPAGTPAVAGGGSGQRVTTELDGRHLARARHAGGWVALAEATALRPTPEEAWAVIGGRPHPFVPPTLEGAGLGFVRASALKAAAAVCDGADLVSVEHATPEAVAGIHAKVVRAWQAGRDAIWPAALDAAAMRTIGTHEPEQFLVGVIEDRLRALAEAVNGQPPAAVMRPYVRTARPNPAGGVAESVPEGWVAQPIGRWFGPSSERWFGPSGVVDAEVVYDPRRFDVTVTRPHGRQGLGEAEVWERLDSDGVQVVWVRDRIDAARDALARLDQRTSAAGVAGPGSSMEAPARGVEL